jgi:hypothetical protein
MCSEVVLDVGCGTGVRRGRRAASVAERNAETIAACPAGALDRIGADAIASMGGAAWAAALVGDPGRPDGEDTWLVLENTGGETAGYVAVGAFGQDTRRMLAAMARNGTVPIVGRGTNGCTGTSPHEPVTAGRARPSALRQDRAADRQVCRTVGD